MDIGRDMHRSALTRRLGGTARLGEETAGVVDALADTRIRNLQPGTEILGQGSLPEHFRVVRHGWLAGQRALGDGRVQIIRLLLPGDLCGLDPRYMRACDHSLVALTEASVALLKPDEVEQIFAAHPAAGHALEAMRETGRAIQREWTLAVGRMSALERMAHLFCELLHRQWLIGESDGTTCALPLSQVQIADTLAISSVHVSRIFSDLKHRGIVDIGDGALNVHDLPRLRKRGCFDPGYLELPDSLRPRGFHRPPGGPAESRARSG